MPDLIGVQSRTYLDKGGLERHRSIGDLMRYMALNQALDLVATYDGYIPAGVKHKALPPAGKSPFPGTFDRYSEAQLFALAKYVYSLRKAGPHQYEGVFTLTMKGTPHDVTLPFTISAAREVKGQLRLNRLDYGIGKKSLVLADEVRVSIRLKLAD